MPILLADRFYRADRGVTVDLASGEEVTVRLAPAGSPADQQRWATRCAALYGCWHPHLAGLVDFGTIGPRDRFEAYRLAAHAFRWARRDADSAGALQAVVAFLHSLGLSAGALAWNRVVDGRGELKLVPDAGTGRPVDEGSAGDTTPRELATLARMLKDCRDRERPRLAAVGLVLQPRVAVGRVVEWLENTPVGGLSCLYLAAPPMAGVTTTLGLIAREARVRGFVPVARPLLSQQIYGLPGDPNGLSRMLTARHVMVLDNHVPLGDAESAMATGALSRLLLALGRKPTRSVLAVVAVPFAKADHPRVDLDPLPQASLRRSVVLGTAMTRTRATAVATASRAAEGRPGLFVRALQKRLCSGSAWRTASVPEQACEPTAAYDAGPARASGTRGRQPAAGGDGRARELLDEGRRLVDLGRHASAERVLRAAVSGLARRDDALHVGLAAMQLGTLLLDRGRAPAASEVLRTAHDYFQRAQATAGATCAAVYVGLTQTDVMKLAEAEAVLRAAYVAARNVRDPTTVRFARVALARCLLWQERYPEARALLEGDSGAEAADRSPGDDLSGLASDQRVRLLSVAARVALAQGHVVEAGRLAHSALDCARGREDAGAVALAHTTLAGLHAKVGDLEALRLHVQQGLAAASRAHAPLRALRLRLTLVEGLLEGGRAREARSHVRRLASLKKLTLPELLWNRVEAVLGALSGGSDAPSRRHQPLARETCDADARSHAVSPSHAQPNGYLDLEAITEVLRLCHEVEDEHDALSRIAATIRKRTGAIAAGFFGTDAHAAIPLVSDGSLQPQTAQRAVDSGLLLEPGPCATGIEAAAPIRYAGKTAGAVVCRWAAEGPLDARRSAALLSTAAAACAPLVRTLLDRRSMMPSTPGAGEFDLTGTSPAIADLRRAIARAACAPFAVLIEGESGCGKELVARAIHRAGARRERKFCPLNCAALSDELIEAELFGHARGAFTGAVAERTGLFEDASGGTMFLDEISELSPRAQAKLLRVIQEGEIRRVGENFARPIDARVVAATNRSLRAEVEAGRFRRDLLYRLDVIRIAVPPLRERIEDLLPLAVWFWRRTTERIASRAVLGQATLAALARYDWPGNVRELQNVLSALAVSAPRRGIVGPDALPAALARFSRVSEGRSLEEARRLFDQRFVGAALARSAGHRGRTAASLGVTRQGLAKLMHRLRLDLQPDARRQDVAPHAGWPGAGHAGGGGAAERLGDGPRDAIDPKPPGIGAGP
jgi:DNA-binding NtrC family response regulator/predicted negative regulator of RcsB-dependent stress response